MMTIREKASICSYFVFFVLFIFGITIFIKLIPRDNPELMADYNEKINVYIPLAVKLVNNFSFANSITVTIEEYKKIPGEEKFMTVSFVNEAPEWKNMVKINYYTIKTQGEIPFAFTASKKFPIPTGREMDWGQFGWQGKYLLGINEGKIYFPMKYVPTSTKKLFLWFFFPILIIYYSIIGAVWARKYLIKNSFFGRYDSFGMRST